MLLWIIFPLAMALIMYRMYQSGLMVLNCKSALTYIGKNRNLSASFTRCSGYTKRVLRYSVAHPCRITLEQALTRGYLQAEVYDGQKNLLLTLDEGCPSGAFHAEPGVRYTLVLRFHKADGRYELTIS